METKICSKCKLDKSLEDFNKRNRSKDGLNNNCKICTNNEAKLYRKINKEKVKEAVNKWRIENPDKIKEYSKINKEKINEYGKEYRNNNKETIKTKDKKYRDEHKEKIKKYAKKYTDENPEYKKDWYQNNKTKIYSQRKKYNKTIPHILAWRRMLKRVLKQFDKKKEGHTIDILGYSAIDLKNHITVLFTDGMTWNNYGEWQIDHIKRVAEFDSTTQPSIVNALSNLRPLWATTREINGVIYEGNLNRDKY